MCYYNEIKDILTELRHGNHFDHSFHLATLFMKRQVVYYVLKRVLIRVIRTVYYRKMLIRNRLSV